MVGLVGVQSNQFPRALDIARPLRAAGIAGRHRRLPRLRLLAMLPEMQADLQAALDMGFTLFAGEAEGRIDEVLRDAAAGTLKPHLQLSWTICRRSKAAPTPILPARTIGAHRQRHHDELRRRARLPVPVLVLHHHQRAGPQIAPPLARRRRAADPAQHYAEGINRFFITDDNFARNKDWEPIFDRLIELRERDKHRRPPHHPGRHAVPQDAELHREGSARRRHARVHRAREHQSRQPARRQEAAEQDHRIPQDAAGLEEGRRHDLCRLHPRLPGRHAGVDPRRHRDHQEGTAARHPGVLLPDAAAGLGGSQDAVQQRGAGWIPT